MAKTRKPPQLSEPRFQTLSFLSDFGSQDEFVGVTKSVIYEIAPFARIVDISHNISPYNVRAAALMIARSVGYLCPGVVLAVVDPGVGSDRRAIAIEVGAEGTEDDGGAKAVLIGPDNGLLAPATALLGGAGRVVELTNTTYQIPSLGNSFAARDIFAPAAAHIMKGVELGEFGAEIDPNSLTPHLIPVSRSAEDGGIFASVLWIDRFGNVQLNIEAADVEQLIGAKLPTGHQSDSQNEIRIQLRFKDVVRTLKLVETYVGLNQGELGLSIDSYGLASIVANKDQASMELQIQEGDEIELKKVTAIL